MIRLWTGDSLELLPMLDDNSVDSVVTDPPYHLTSGKKGGSGEASLNLNSPAGRARVTTGFMGQKWDGGDIAFRPELWSEVLRTMKPGAYLLAFGGTRTYHRMAVAIEDAGFEIRDQLGWLYGQGFPKSLNCGDGRGTALKPAWEPIVMARKPLEGTVAKNIAKWRTGAINIDACRVEGTVTTNPLVRIAPGFGSDGLANQGSTGRGGVSEGRWPANIIHDGSDEVVAAFPMAASRADGAPKNNHIFGQMNHATGSMEPRADATKSASQFFYCAKTTGKDRDEGCDHLPVTSAADMVQREEGSDGMNSPRAGAGRTSGRRNHHPTIKPTALMRYLCRLVTPPNGIVLDPFMGSGSTGKAAVLEGFSFTGMDLSPEYTEIARARIAAVEGPSCI